MTAVTAATWVFALLLAVAGAGKIARPAATGAALQVAHLPSDRRLVRALGAAELILAMAVLLVAGAVATAALSAAYAAFAGFAFAQARQGAGCGCFGATSAPATGLHVGVNVAGAVLAAAVVLRPGPRLMDAFQGPLQGVLLIVALASTAALLRLALTALPELEASRRLLTAEADA